MGHRLFRGSGRLALILGILDTIGFFWVNIVGFVDTDTGSALGCGHDWPLCNGMLIPNDWGLHTLIEFMHRAMVGIVVVLLILFAFFALINYRKWKEIKVLISLSFAFVVLQSFLGALGVLLPQDPPELLAIHLGVSLMALNAIFLSTVVIWQIRRQARIPAWSGRLRKPVANSRFNRLVRWTTIYTFLAMYIGAYVAKSGYAASFRGWPLPTEHYSIVGNVLILDYVHRIVAFGIVLLALGLIVRAYKMRVTNRNLFVGSVAFLVFVCLQAVSGMLLIASNLSIWAFLTHVTIVSCLFGCLCYLWMQGIRDLRAAS